MARIYGILRNATGIRPNTKIILTAKRTSTQVVIFAPDRLVTTDANGRYNIECNVCSYLVTIMQSGLPIEHVGSINVYADSADGTLESFLTDIREDELTPEVIKRVEEAAKLAELSASKAEQAAASAADDAINNVMPTLDNKIKLANDEVIKAKGEVTKATAQANIAKDAAQEALHNASLTFISGGTFTPKSSAEYPNVSGVVRDTIWLISFPNRDDKYVYTAGVLKGITVKSGDQLFYDTPQDEFKWLPSGAGGAVYSVNGKTGTSITLTNNDVNAYSKSQIDSKDNAIKSAMTTADNAINATLNLLVNAYKSEVEPIGTIKPWMSDNDIPDGWHHIGAQTQSEVTSGKRVYDTATYPEFTKFLGGNELQLCADGEVLRQVVKHAKADRDITTPWVYQSDAIRNITGYIGNGGTGWMGGNPTGCFVGVPTAPEGTQAVSSNIDNGYKYVGANFDISKAAPTATDNRMANRSVNYIIKVKHSAAYYALINAIA